MNFQADLREQTSRGSRILVLDDDPSSIEFLEHVFATDGSDAVLLPSDGRDAAARLDEIAPDLIILDLRLPGFDALDFMERVREWVGDKAYVPVLVVTGDAANEPRRAALAAGAADFLLKPLSPGEVRLRVRNLLHIRFLHAELRLHNAELEGRVTERTAALDQARRDTLDRLARAAEYRDDQTGRHTQRVGRLAARLAEELDRKEEEVELIRRAAPLHDIGKIGVPDSILLKDGPLSAEERALMKKHTEIGARILAGSDDPLLRLAEEIALTHHERWDGAGYPRRLNGEEIPLSGRIVMVADVFDSLTHVRPYKRAWTVREALEEIRANAGRQFDPRVVEALLHVVPEVTTLNGGTPSSNGATSRQELQLELAALHAERDDLNRRIRSIRRSLAAESSSRLQEP
jgi:putative two-component system response regulator